jgi:hypothetical protein
LVSSAFHLCAGRASRDAHSKLLSGVAHRPTQSGRKIYGNTSYFRRLEY